MKKRESLWQLLKRLDDEAGQFNSHLSKANHYFDGAAKKTKLILQNHEKHVHKTLGRLRKIVKMLVKKKQDQKKKE